MSKLQPCYQPGCNGEVKTRSVYSHKLKKFGWVAECACGYSTALLFDESQAIAAHNRMYWAAKLAKLYT